MIVPTLIVALDEQVVQLNISIAIFAIIQATWFWTNIVIICAELRIAFSMFLQLNPYYEPFATLWTFTDPIFNFGRAYYPKILGFDMCPWVNMLLLQELVVGLDIWLHGINEMNSISDQRTMENQELGVDVGERYIFVDKYLRAGEPKTEKEWLESFSFEDIYFHRVPGAPPFSQGPHIKIPTSLPINDRLPISAQTYPDIEDLGNIEYGISLGDNPLNWIFHIVLEIVHIPLHLLQFLASH